MKKNRIEAFSDGVLAIIITIMVLEFKAPNGDDINDLLELWPSFLSYIISFIYLGIYWNNHHHLLHTVHKLTAGIMLSNLNLLFWLSLIPFVTAWIGKSHFTALPMATYGLVLLLSGLSYVILQSFIMATHGRDSVLAKAIGKDVKGKMSAVLYSIAILLAFVRPWISGSIYFLVAIFWLIPDKRIELAFRNKEE